ACPPTREHLPTGVSATLLFCLGLGGFCSAGSSPISSSGVLFIFPRSPGLPGVCKRECVVLEGEFVDSMAKVTRCELLSDGSRLPPFSPAVEVPIAREGMAPGRH